MKTVLVTGGAKGIGRAIVEKFAENGYRVILNYKTSKEKAEEIKSKYSNVEIYKADVSNFSEVKKMCEEVGDIDILVNNAGIAQTKLFTDITETDWDNMINTNLKSVYNCTKCVLDYMIHKKEGKIINISSMWGEIGGSCEVHYSASKAGIIGLTKALSKELALSNIQVNCVSPGIIDTDMNKMHNLSELKEEVPTGTIGTPRDIANTVYFLAQDENNYITGQVISVNGGIC